MLERSSNSLHHGLMSQTESSMRFYATLIAIVVVLLITLYAARATAQDDTDFQPWTAVFASGPVSDSSRLLLWFDGHARMRDDASNLGVTILRPGLGWRMNDRLDIWLGYARVTGHVPGPNIDEDRIWQQATYPISTVFGGSLSGRTRTEQRFRNQGGTGHRLRQMLRWSRSIGSGPFSALLSDELFLNINDTSWGQASGFDQNRLFIGGAMALGASARFELGYLYNRLRDERANHVVSAAIFFSL